MSPSNDSRYDVIVIGAGAAGMMCAIEAGRRGRRVLLLDKAKKPGRKILISGGGRCNFTNLHASPEHYVSANPHFCKSALARYTQWDFIALLESRGLGWHEKKLGQLFCDQRAPAVVAMLVELCEQAGVIIRSDSAIESIEKDNAFAVTTNTGRYRAASLVIATGGPSVPRMGASDFAIDVARQFGIPTRPFRPGLVPLKLAEADRQRLFGGLAGTAVEAVVGCNGIEFRENLLVTHRGLSGPAILQISSYWRPGDSIRIDLLPDIDAAAWAADIRRQSPDLLLKNALAQLLPRRLAQHLAVTMFADQPIRRFDEATLRRVITTLRTLAVTPTGSEGLRTAEVCLGGIDTDALSSKTMECKRVAGLYFIGEAVDVTGQLGGYNFQWAWSSGWCAGQYV